MEMHHVRYFLALCDERNFTRAAKRCAVAQPSLSRAIKQLEHELGGPLFERARTNVRLSDLGELVRPQFVHIGHCVTDIKRKAAHQLNSRNPRGAVWGKLARIDATIRISGHAEPRRHLRESDRGR
jgi:DNA-binding transcriptional LysR family regulator